MFEINADNALQELVECINTVCKLLPASTTTPHSIGLFVIDVEITRPILALMAQLLTLPLPQASPGIVSKWLVIYLTECRFARQPTTRLPTEDDQICYCSPDEIHVLALTLTRRTDTLGLTNCPDILESLFHLPQLEVVHFCLEDMGLPALQCERLVGLVQRSVPLMHGGLMSVGRPCCRD